MMPAREIRTGHSFKERTNARQQIDIWDNVLQRSLNNIDSDKLEETARQIVQTYSCREFLISVQNLQPVFGNFF